MRKVQKFGWKPQLPDHRDYKIAKSDKDLPKSVDLRKGDSPIYDQGALGSCTANAIAAAYAFDLAKQKEVVFNPSRLFIYYNERAMEGTVNQDAGAEIRDGIKSINKLGVCDEKLWPYLVAKFKSKPSKSCFSVATKNKAVSYASVNQTEQDIKAVLASGYPVVFGFTVYDYFESAAMAKSGALKMPKKGEQVVGGHAVMIVGYDEKDNFIVRNSWGTDWGKKGYFTIPVEYVTNPSLASDFWVVKAVN